MVVYNYISNYIKIYTWFFISLISDHFVLRDVLNLNNPSLPFEDNNDETLQWLPSFNIWSISGVLFQIHIWHNICSLINVSWTDISKNGVYSIESKYNYNILSLSYSSISFSNFFIISSLFFCIFLIIIFISSSDNCDCDCDGWLSSYSPIW